ncbi:MAG: hypothetical protein AAFY52_07075 [Pseudomonadota bacterium]
MRNIEDAAAALEAHGTETPEWLERAVDRTKGVPVLAGFTKNVMMLWHLRVFYTTTRIAGFCGVTNRALFNAAITPVLCAVGVAMMVVFGVLDTFWTMAAGFPNVPALFWGFVLLFVYMIVEGLAALVTSVAILHGTYDHACSGVAPDHHFDVRGLRFPRGQNVFSPKR